MAAVRDNKTLGRFELDIEGTMAFANYRVTPQAVIITHTETPRALRGRGIASELIKGSLDLIRADGHKVIAGCGFVADYLYKHPEYADLMV
jgi:predicted GNAT family acetyltransferase